MNALCNLLRKKSREIAASLPGRFLSRRCFTLCITMEVRSSTNATTVAVAKIAGGKGMEGGKRVSLHHFLADKKIASSWKKCVSGHPITRATSYCMLPDTF